MSGLWLSEANLGLCTDLYQLTMAAGYWATGRNAPCVFELFVRELPPHRGYLVGAGLEQALYYLEHLRFTGDQIDYLRSLPVFTRVPPGFFEALRHLRFEGDVWAIPEGTPFFPHEPIVRIEAPAMVAQIVETFLLATINFQTSIATKAARIVDAARGRPVYDFGTRRAHGPQAALWAARAAIIGGCAGTSNVLAARELGVPAVGTMAHAWVMGFDREEEAFARFQELYPDSPILVIDTYDTRQGARRAARLGSRLHGVRLDSGDLVSLACDVRRILDEAGCRHARIIASGDLDEYKINALLDAGAPMDAFGVGTELVTSRDAPALGGVYKLVERTHGGRIVGVVKQSQDKATWPGRKQVFRSPTGDLVALEGETQEGTPLLSPVMKGGRRLAPPPDLRQIRQAAQTARDALPAGVRRLRGPQVWPVRFSEALQEARRAAAGRIEKEEPAS